MMLSIPLPLPPKELSPNARVHYMARARATKRYREACGRIAAYYKRLKGWKTCAVVLSVEYRCSRDAVGYVAKDIQNAISAIKAGVDGLVDAGIAPNDSRKFLTWDRMELITRKQPKGDGVTIIVRGAL